MMRKSLIVTIFTLLLTIDASNADDREDTLIADKRMIVSMQPFVHGRVHLFPLFFPDECAE